MTYAYRAISNTGIALRGTIDAETEAGAREQLRSRNLIVINVRSRRQGLRGLDLKLRRKARRRDVLLACRQLGRMLSAGTPLLMCFQILARQAPSDLLRETFTQIENDLRGGTRSLSEAMARYPRVFSEVVVSIVAVGDASGKTHDVLSIAARQLEREDYIARQARSAAIYPVITLVLAFCVTAGVLTFLIPQFAAVLEQINPGKPLPTVTQLLIDISAAFASFWWVVLLLGAGVLMAIQYALRRPAVRQRFDDLKLRLPLRIGETIRQIVVARWARGFASLLSVEGMGLLEAVQISKRTAGNAAIESAMDDVYRSVRVNGGIATPLANHRAFTPDVVQMIDVGEESGSVGDMLAQIADFYEEDVDVAVKGLADLLGPVLILAVSLVVGVIAIALYLPLGEMVRGIV